MRGWFECNRHEHSFVINGKVVAKLVPDLDALFEHHPAGTDKWAISIINPATGRLRRVEGVYHLQAAKDRAEQLIILQPSGGAMTRKQNPTRQIKTLSFVARRWFQRTLGNTYHAVKVYVDNKLVFTSPVQYGYGDQWEQTALEWLKANGIIPQSYAYIRMWADDHGVSYTRNVEDVKTQRELKAFAGGRATNPVAKKAPTKRTTNPADVIKTVFMVVVKRPRGKSPAGYWTGSKWDTERRLGKMYRDPAKAIEKANALKKGVTPHGWVIAVISTRPFR